MSSNVRILIVDDERDFAEALGFLLAHQGFSVDWAFDGDEALLRLKQQEFQYVVSDYRMPCVSGTELFEYAQKEIVNPPKFIFITGFLGGLQDYEFSEEVLGVYPKTIHYKNIVDKINDDVRSSHNAKIA